MFSITLRARWIFPIAARPLANSTLTLAGSRIVALGDDAAATHDLGNVALLPGLVNAHAHLELSDLEQPLGTPGVRMADWIRLVLRSRSGRLVKGVERGAAELMRQGVTAVGDIAQPAATDEFLPRIDAVRFLELIGPTSERAQAAIELARQNAGARFALSPHAPYTVHPQLLAEAIRLSAERHVPLAFHLAESREELQLLRDGSGPLRDLLDQRDSWTPDLVTPDSRPLDYLVKLVAAHRALVIHGNYLDAEEIALLAAHHQRMAVVYCPRTHAWFGHDPYPLSQMLAAGCTVALGTDSRASAPDLSLFAELRAAAGKHSDVSLETLLAIATWGGARALGLAADQGTLEPGKLANLTVVSLPADAASAYEALFSAESQVVGRYWHGCAD